MKHIKPFNENDKISFEDLILLFAGLSDDGLSTYRRGGVAAGDQITHTRQIAITIGEYFRSNPILLKDIVNPETEKDKEDSEKVLSYLERNKPFYINIQINSKDKLEDTLHILEFVKSNKDQMEYFGYKLEDFYSEKQKSINEWSQDLLTLKYISKN